MDTTTKEEAARLLTDVPNLARPLRELEADIFRWASTQEMGECSTREQFERQYQQLIKARVGINSRRILDYEIARGSLRALELRPASGWDGYVEQWTVVRLEHQMTSPQKPGLVRLRALEERIGGILLDSRRIPLMLVLPQPGGTYIQMGWESIVELDTSPFDARRNLGNVLREHLLPESERTFTAPA